MTISTTEAVTGILFIIGFYWILFIPVIYYQCKDEGIKSGVKYGAFVLPVIVWMFFGFILIPITFLVLLLRKVGNIPQILMTEIAGVSIAW